MIAKTQKQNHLRAGSVKYGNKECQNQKAKVLE